MGGYPNFDEAWAVQLAEFCANAYAEFLTIPESEVTQVDLVLTADPALDCACVTYALGADLEDVRIWIARAAHLLGQAFALRGTTPHLPLGRKDIWGNLTDITPPGPDQSLTNSRRGLLAMHTALAAGDLARAERTASLVGDPPDAAYIGPDSVVCTPPEQQLAYALREILLGREVSAVFYVGGIQEDDPPLIRHQATSVYALINRDVTAFTNALDRLLAAHAFEAAEPAAAREPRRFLCLPAVAVAALATERTLIDAKHLPDQSIYFPRDLIEAARR